jgi:hypothetical protein
VLWLDARGATLGLVFTSEGEGVRFREGVIAFVESYEEYDLVSASEAQILTYVGDALTFRSSDGTIRDSHYERYSGDGLVPLAIT